jgi:hypothetical protein
VDFFSILWLFFIISSLQPVIRQKMTEAARWRMLETLESQRKSRVITLCILTTIRSSLPTMRARTVETKPRTYLLLGLPLANLEVMSGLSR